MGFLAKIIIEVGINGLSLYFMTLALENVQYTGGYWFFIIGGLFIGFLNFFIKPLIKILSLPFIFITGGLFLIVINAFILWLFQGLLNVIQFNGVSVLFPDFWSYVLGALIFGIVNWILHIFFK